MGYKKTWLGLGILFFLLIFTSLYFFFIFPSKKDLSSNLEDNFSSNLNNFSQEESSQLIAEVTQEDNQVNQELNIIVYTDKGFSPNILKIKVGEKVIFKNESSQPMWPASDVHPNHSVYSGTTLFEHCGTPLENSAFDACRGILPGDSWSFIFEKKGSWNFHDHLNPQYRGTIIVE